MCVYGKILPLSQKYVWNSGIHDLIFDVILIFEPCDIWY